MSKITADEVYGDQPTDPLESERYLSEYIEDLVDVTLSAIPRESIVTEARAHFPNDDDGQRAQVVALVCTWFETNVDADGFDTDVYVAARQQVFESIGREVSQQRDDAPNRTSRFKRTETVY